MSEFHFQRWIEQAVNHPGVTACGILQSNHYSCVKTRDEALPEASLGELLKRMSEVASTLHNSRLGSSRLCWVFEHAQIHYARCADGTTAIVATGKDPDVAIAVHELFADLESLVR